MELVDTLVVFYVGVDDLESCFRACAPNKSDGWHVTGARAGVAVELLLRFPQVFPVFLSLDVPLTDPVGNERSWGRFGHSTPDETRFSDFWHLITEISSKHKGPITRHQSGCAAGIPPFAFGVVPHFVSPVELGAFESTLARFSRGMRCWFDPTGLRTMVKNRFLGTIFGSQDDWSSTRGQRDVPLQRLQCVAVSVDEERAFALINAYAAYKFGRRAWVVTTFAEFDGDQDIGPLWVASANYSNSLMDVVVLRDVDLRFPDLPENDPSEKRCDAKALREQLKDVRSEVWLKCRNGTDRITPSWRVRVVTSNARVAEQGDCSGISSNNGMTADGCLLGLTKPIPSLYELGALLGDSSMGCQMASIASVTSRIKPVEGNASGHHGAPYLNLEIAESLLYQAGRCANNPIENLMGAFLAGEAYELLLGMSKTTALDALLIQHKREVAAEGGFPGVSETTDIENRQRDIEATVKLLLSLNTEQSRQRSVSDLFLVKFWSELKLSYRSGEQFHAAEGANLQSLTHSDWMTGFPRTVRTIFAAIPPKWRNRLKYRVVRVGTSFESWALTSVVTAVSATIAYGLVKPDTLDTFGELFLSVMLSSITLQPMTIVSKILTDCPGTWSHVVAILHMGVSYFLFGMLISMLYRKLTRG